MSRKGLLALVVLALACKKPTPPPPILAASASASAAPLGPPPPPAPSTWKPTFETPPSGSEPLRLVAVGRSPRSKVLSLGLYGDTMWLSTNGTDATAEKNGPIEKRSDPLDKLPYEPGVHDLVVVGMFPALFVLRTAKKGPPAPTVFVARGDGAWHEAQPLPFGRKPIAFLAYGMSAVAITGVHVPGENPDSYFSGEQPGTLLTRIDPDGTTRPLYFPPWVSRTIAKDFIAWGGAWDKTGISLAGSVAEETDLSYGPHWVPVGTYVLQLPLNGSPSLTKVQPKKHYHSIVPGTVIYRDNGMTTAEPEHHYIGDNERWLPNNATTYRVGAGGLLTSRSVASNRHNYLFQSRFVGDNLYTIQGYRPSERQSDPVTFQLLRAGPPGITELIRLPSIQQNGADVACEPYRVLAGHDDDLWILAKCGCDENWLEHCQDDGTPALFRRGGPAQSPLTF